MENHESDDRAEQPAPKAGAGGWLKLGCLGIVLLGLVSVAGGILYMRRVTESAEKLFADPGARAQFAQKLLGTERFPPGLFPAMAMTMPGMVDVVLLGDRLPRADGTPDMAGMTRGFLFTRARIAGDDTKLLAYYEGRAIERPSSRINIEAGRLVRTGKLESEGVEVLYRIARRPPPQVRHGAPAALALEFSARCADGKPRVGLWFVPDPNPGMELTEIEAENTPFDDASVRNMLESFKLCLPIE